MKKHQGIYILFIVIALLAGYFIGFYRGSVTSDPSASPAVTAAARSLPVSATDPPLRKPSYVYNRNTHKFHLPSCSSVNNMAAKNTVFWYESRSALLDKYPSAVPCQRCNP